MLGILYLDNLTSVGSFSDEDLQFIVAFSGLAALGIRNSRYAEQTRREAMVRSNLRAIRAECGAADRAAAGRGQTRRRETADHSALRRHPRVHHDVGIHEPGRDRPAPQRIFRDRLIIFEHGGTLDKFIGDAMMALWGAPIPHDDDPDRALRAAIAMQQALARLNEQWAATGRPTLGVGIGINYGEVFAGNIGSHRRLNYTVIGDSVNIAARLCSRAEAGQVLVTEAFGGW